MALAAADRGADVLLAAANIDASVLRAAELHPQIRVEPVSTTKDLEQLCRAEAGATDVVVMAAAVADYRIAQVSDTKMRKEDSGGEAPVLHLTENPDILRGLVDERRPGQILVGFAAETAETTAELLERGRRKRQRKDVDLLAVNAVGWNEGFERDENSLHIIDASGEVVAQATGSKSDVAWTLLDAVISYSPKV